MLTCDIINGPSRAVLEILKRKSTDEKARELIESGRVEAVGLIQGRLAHIIVAADVAEKAADVLVAEIMGSCQHHTVLIAVFGRTSAVKAALNAVKTLTFQD